MKDSTWRGFQKLERNKEKILIFLRTRNADELKNSADGSWSMIQAMRHIQMSEDSIVKYLEKKMKAGDEMPIGTVKGRIYLRIMFLAFFLRFKFKAPKSLPDPSITSLEELEADWNRSRERMKEFIIDFPAKWESKAIYKHPAGMRVNLADTIRFLSVHLRHHIHQVHRIKRSLRG